MLYNLRVISLFGWIVVNRVSSRAALGFLGFALVAVVVAVPLLAAKSGPTRKGAVIAAGDLLPKASATPTPSPKPTWTPTAAASPLPRVTNTASPTPTSTQTPSLTPTPTHTPSPTYTPSPTPTSTPLPTPDGGYREFEVPILMYHYVSVPPIDADEYRLDLSVSPSHFADHLLYLRSAGYTSIDLYHLLDALTWGRPLPDKPVIITLDDGYRDNYENAFPQLLEYGYTATFFVLTEPMDHNSERHMTWSQTEEMAAAGMDIEPHSRSHPNLQGADHDSLVWEILGSVQSIQGHTGHYPRFFAYPYSRYDEQVMEFLKEINLWGAVTIWSGSHHIWEDRYELLRIRVRGGDTAAILAAKLGD